MSDIFIVRQPIFDRTDTAVAYELRFRDPGDGSDPFARSYLSGSFEVLRDGLPAYVRCARRQLVEGIFLSADPRSLVLLYPADLVADDETLAATEALSRLGVTIALDEYDERSARHAARERFFPFASHVRFDLRGYDDATQLTEVAQRLRAQHRRLCADFVDDVAVHRRCMALGFERFDGTLFSRPEPLPAAELPASTATALQLLSLARNPSTSDRALENAVSSDPGLTFQLLRLVNNAAAGMRGIQSIGHAIRLVGRSAFVRWLALAFTTARASQSGIDNELARQAVQRAHMCEALAGGGRDKGTLFLVGLFSLLDGVFRMPLEDVLTRVNLAPEVSAALLERTGPYADALAFVESYELGLWESAAEIASMCGVSPDALPQIYAAAVTFAGEQLSPDAPKKVA